jgi:hypothetical protein
MATTFSVAKYQLIGLARFGARGNLLVLASANKVNKV